MQASCGVSYAGMRELCFFISILCTNKAYKLDFQGVQWFQPPVHHQSWGCHLHGVKGLIILELPVSRDLFTCKTLLTSGGQISWPDHPPALLLLRSLSWRDLAAQKALRVFKISFVVPYPLRWITRKAQPFLRSFYFLFSTLLYPGSSTLCWHPAEEEAALCCGGR